MPMLNPNTELKSSKPKTITGELQYNDTKNEVIFGLARAVISDAIVFDKNKRMYINNPSTTSYNRLYIRETYNIDMDNKVILEYFKMYKEKTLSSKEGMLLQVFNKIDNIDIYNELVYRDGYNIENIAILSGYDWTMSLNYPFSKKLNLKLKAENILNKASKTLINSSILLLAPSVERRFITTMEYTF